MSAAALSIAFFLQMFLILAACRVVGLLARRVGQPQVVGEMIAGVCLGPSLLGALWPAGQQMLFPPASMQVLHVGAQLGVGLYMFLVGVEFKADLFISRARSALSVSVAGMVVPFIAGAALAPWLTAVPGLFAATVQTYQAALFLGAAIAITAFPMLARIIYERGLSGTALGTLALAAGAINDAVAWGVLAVVLASFGGGAWIAVKAIGGGALYAATVMSIGKRWLAKLETVAKREGGLSHTLLGVVLMLLMLAAWAMDAIGIHAVFGGFLLGAAMPRGVLSSELRRQLEPFAVVFLLPMFFTYSGLKTQLGLVIEPGYFLIACVVLVVSILAKGVACWLAARWHGEDNRTAMAVGALMNARGLMELIILNIGLEKGLITPGLFSIFVLMAIVTTLMASPLFHWVYGRHQPAQPHVATGDSQGCIEPENSRPRGALKAR